MVRFKRFQLQCESQAAQGGVHAELVQLMGGASGHFAWLLWLDEFEAAA